MNIDVVMPKGNEQELAKFAENLGFRKIIFLYTNTSEKAKIPESKITIKSGILVSRTNDIGAAKNRFDYVFAPAERQFVESKNVDFIVNAESSELKDFFYQKRSGLDGVMCKLAKSNGIAVVFNVSMASDKVILGRMRQNARLCRKHKLEAFSASFARSTMRMSAPKDLEAFSRIISLL